jgi:tyrosyl-tRNA synthetase
MLQKDSVRNRLGADSGFSFTEFTYMLLQSYDFWQLYRSPLQVTLQIGGSDQWGNITTGIDFVRKVEGATVYGMTTPLVTRADGRKFGKSESGAVWLDGTKTSPFALYQFFLRSEDEMVISYLRYFTFLALEEIDHLEVSQLQAPEQRLAHQKLAFEVTEIVHGRDEARRAEEASRLIYGDGEISHAPLDVIRLAFSEALQQRLSRLDLKEGMKIDDFAGRTPLFSSKGEARRVIAQGGLSLNGHRVGAETQVDEQDLLHDSVMVMRRGKRDYCLIELL